LTAEFYIANRIRKATIRQNSPMASDRANPRIAYENSCCFRDGFLAYPMMRLPNTVPIPAPDPATPTVAAPAPMNLAAVSISLLTALVWKPLSATWVRGLCGITATLLSVFSSGLDSTEADRGL